MSKEMPNGVPKSAVKEIKDNDAKLDMIVEYVAATNEKIDNMNEKIENIESTRRLNDEKQEQGCDERYEKCDNRFKKLEKLAYGVGGVVVLGSIVSPIVVAWIG